MARPGVWVWLIPSQAFMEHSNSTTLQPGTTTSRTSIAALLFSSKVPCVVYYEGMHFLLGVNLSFIKCVNVQC